MSDHHSVNFGRHPVLSNPVRKRMRWQQSRVSSQLPDTAAVVLMGSDEAAVLCISVGPTPDPAGT
jgi:hypothetical protein